MDDIMQKFDLMDKTPSSLLNNIAPAPQPDIADLLSHTEKPFTPPPNGPAMQGGPGQTMPVDGQRLNAGNLLTPDMAVGFFNIILPAVMVIVFKRIGKLTIKTQFEASQKELEIIKPILGKYLDSVHFSVESPLNALLITVGFIYGSKAIEVLNNAPSGSIRTNGATIVSKAAVVNNESVHPPAQSSAFPEKPKKYRPVGMKYNKNK